MTDTQLVPLAETMQLGEVLARSGFFKDGRDASQAVVKVLAGREIGIGPIASMAGIYIVEGKVSIGANLMAAAVKRSGKYDYTVVKLDNTQAVIMFWQKNPKTGDFVELGESSFTIAEAQAAGVAGKQVWKAYPRNMLFARAISNGVRWYCPDIFGGAPVYAPEELGATVDGETGEVIDAPRVITVETPRQEYTLETARAAIRDADASNGNGANPLPFRMTEQGAIEWAMATAPQVWPVDAKGIIIKQVVESSFRKLAKDQDLHGEALGRAWVAKIAGKLDDRAKAAIITDAELAPAVAGEGDEEPQF